MLLVHCRAPYKEVEPHLQAWALQNLTNCSYGKTCVSNSAHKVVYRLDFAAAAQPLVHGPRHHFSRVDQSWNRSLGVCCNHYMLRSKQELVEKYTKGMVEGFYAPMLKAHPQAWYTAVPDTLIWQYLPDLQATLHRRLTVL